MVLLGLATSHARAIPFLNFQLQRNPLLIPAAHFGSQSAPTSVRTRAELSPILLGLTVHFSTRCSRFSHFPGYGAVQRRPPCRQTSVAWTAHRAYPSASSPFNSINKPCMVVDSIAEIRDDGWRASEAVKRHPSRHDSPCWRGFRPVLPCSAPSCKGQGNGTREGQI